MQDENLPGIEEIGYQFKNLPLLREAMTHASYSAENALTYDNQRLEFLGDSVIQMVTTVHLFKKHPNINEGELTKMRSFLAQRSTLANFANHIHLDNFIKMGRGEIKNDGHKRESTLCDAFEALCGAIFLDGGMTAAGNFIIPLIEYFYPSTQEIVTNFNPKGFLQELTQSKFSTKPEYRIESYDGPDHNKTCSVSVWINGKKIASASANSRKGAESRAAEDAIKIISLDDTAPNL
ncbi:MAG TPA: ribonuclease III [Victivallales bacterium]|nr:ribonuclease III [Victivallales bacterium]